VSAGANRDGAAAVAIFLLAAALVALVITQL